MRRRLLAPTILLAAAVAACGSQAQSTLVGYKREPTPNVAVVTLPSVQADGAESDFSFHADPEGILLVYFGYTSCPDVCPTTLSDVGRTLDNLDAEESGRLEVAMVTVDPEVDTPDILVDYVRSFVPAAHAVRSTDTQRLGDLAEGFGASFGHGGDGIEHTGSLYAVNSEGDLVLTWPYGVTADDLESDIRQLLSDYELE